MDHSTADNSAEEVILVDTETMSTSATKSPKFEKTTEITTFEDDLSADSSVSDTPSTSTPCRRVIIDEEEEPVKIGRASRTNPERASSFANLFFDNAHLSKQHAQIEYDDGFRVRDLYSTFGTIINGLVLTPESPVDLHDGDVLGLIMLKPSRKIAAVFDKFENEKLIPLNEFGNPKLGIQKRISIVDNTIEFYDIEGSEGADEQSDSPVEQTNDVVLEVSDYELTNSEDTDSDATSGDELSFTQIIFDALSDDEESEADEQEQPESRKRTFSDMEHEDSFITLVSEEDVDLQQLLAPPAESPSKRQKTDSWSVKSILKEVGKAFFYTVATVAALGLYGSTIDPEK